MRRAWCPSCKQVVRPSAVTCPHCGTQVRYLKPAWGFEWKTEAALFGLPLVHVAVGRNEEGRMRVAKGVLAIGQFALGVVTFAQIGVGVLFGFGQIMAGVVAVGQIAVGGLFGAGQLATGYVAIGQLVLAHIGMAQLGLAAYLWSPDRADAEAVAFFSTAWEQAKIILGLAPPPPPPPPLP